jgi:outer membrane receptor protein involved in Fe transport
LRETIDRVGYNFNLKPEKIKTLELQAGHKGQQSDMNLTLYRNQYTDFIKELLVASVGPRRVDDEYAINTGSLSITGAEFQALFSPFHRMTVNCNMSHIFTAQQDLPALDPSIVTSIPYLQGTTDLPFLSRTMANLMASYRLDFGFKVALGVHYSSNRSVPTTYQTAVPAAVRNPDLANGYTLADLTVSWNWKGLSILGKVNNLTDKRVYSPLLVDESGYDSEWPGRRWRLEVGYRF